MARTHRLLILCVFLLFLLTQPGSGKEAVPAIQEPADLEPGGTFSDTLNSGEPGPEMVVIPAGTFRMGCVSGVECNENELPVREVTIPRRFAVSKYVVTLDEFVRFSPAGARLGHKQHRPGRSPAGWVSWSDAFAYTEWLSRETGETYRLLSEAEWEYVSRAGSTTPYPWGEEFGANHANCWVCGDEFQFYGASGPVSAQRLGSARHAGQRLGVGRGLLERQLRGRSLRRQRLA